MTRSFRLMSDDMLAGVARLHQLIRTVEASNLRDEAKNELLFILRWKERDFLEATRQAFNPGLMQNRLNAQYTS